MSSIEIDTETHEFLNRESGQLAVIGSNARHGHPLLVPVWYRWDGEAIIVWTLESRAWVRNVIRDPRVGVSVHDGPIAVIMRGTAIVETSDDPHIDEEIERISRRYVPSEEMDAYISAWPNLRTLVRIVPSHVYIWSDP